MKTIYECSQSKGIKWLTAIFFLVIIAAILVEVYFAMMTSSLARCSASC